MLSIMLYRVQAAWIDHMYRKNVFTTLKKKTISYITTFIENINYFIKFTFE